MRRDTFLAVDPGQAYFAWLEVRVGTLMDCGLWDFKDNIFEFRRRHFPHIDLCVIEDQRVHSMKSKDDVPKLAQAAGGIAYQFPEQYWVWDTTPKGQRWEQTKKRLSLEELALLDGFTKEEQGHLKDTFAFAIRYLRR